MIKIMTDKMLNEIISKAKAEELETERTRTIREKFFVVENEQTDCQWK